MGATSTYKHVINLLDKNSVYFYEPALEGAFASALIPQASIYIWNTYVSQIYAKSSFLKSSILKLGQALLAYS